MSEYTPTTEEVRLAAHNRAFFPLFRDRVDFDRWLAAHDADVRAGVVTEEPEGQRQFSAAYRARNGHVVNIGMTTAVRADAESVVKTFRCEDDEGPDYFVATRILPPWVPVEES